MAVIEWMALTEWCTAVERLLLQSNECNGRAERKVGPLHTVVDPTRLSNDLVDA
jgi:hypothetical protein